MPIDIVSSVIFDGPQVIPGWDYLKTYAPAAAAVALAKYYFGGSSNTWERDMHGKVYILTGGTSGLGAYLTYYLASKGAQVILLVRSTEDTWVIDYVEDLREKTANIMVYAEECDLASLYSIRKFATKWLDNQPPRRLDGVLCCAAESIPRGSQRQVTIDGVERQVAVNYLAHYHLLTLLMPSLVVQPPDRDVRVLVASCSSQAVAEVDPTDVLWLNRRYPVNAPWQVYGSSKLALGLFVKHFQRKLVEYERKDKSPCNVRVNIVNPGIMRTPSTRRFLSMGTIWGLFLYILTWPLWFVVLKDASQGAQTFIFGLCAPIFRSMEGGNVLQECKIITKTRKEFSDEELQKQVFEATAKALEALEKLSAIERKKREQERKKKEGGKEATREVPKTTSTKKMATRDAAAEKLEEKLLQEDLDAAAAAAATGPKDIDNVWQKPETPQELEHKLRLLRQSIGIGSANKNEMPLFPGMSASEATTGAVSGSSAGQNKPKKKKKGTGF